MASPREKKPLPVLLMSQMLTAGGTERQLTEVAKSLDRTQFTPHVAALRPGGIRAEELEAAGVPVTYFPVSSFQDVGMLGAAFQLARYLRRNRIQIVHTFDVPANVFAVPVAKFCRVPLVLSSQRASRSLTPGAYRKLLRFTDRLVNGIVVNSHAVAQELISDDGVPESRIHLCYNGIDTDLFSPPEPGQRTDRSFTVGCVALLRPEKGQKTLIEAFSQVAKFRTDMRLVLIGGGPMQPELEVLAARVGVAPNCYFEPATTKVADWLRQIDIFVLPSLSEALSNSLMEAMACSCCVVASRVGGNPELIDDGKNGFLFNVGDADDLALRLKTLIIDDTMRRKFAATGRETILNQFSRTASVSRMASIYTDLYKSW